MALPASSPYRVLGVRPSATADEVRRAYAAALRDPRRSRTEVTGAFHRLRDPVRRLAQDLRELDTERLTDALRGEIATEASAPLVDEESVPLPPWSSLVDAGAPGWDPPPRDVGEPVAGFRSAGLLEPPPAAELPVPEFRLP